MAHQRSETLKTRGFRLELGGRLEQELRNTTVHAEGAPAAPTGQVGLAYLTVIAPINAQSQLSVRVARGAAQRARECLLHRP